MRSQGGGEGEQRERRVREADRLSIMGRREGWVGSIMAGKGEDSIMGGKGRKDSIME